jgi:anti-sigma factor RsiW
VERLTAHENLQELLGAYALDAVEPDEVAAIERHLPTCPRCRTELADHREVAALLGYAGGAAPDGVWDRIIASLEEPPPAMRLTTTPIATPQLPSLRPVAPLDPPFRSTLGPAEPELAERVGLGAIAGRVGAKPLPREDTVVPIGSKRRKTVPMRFMVAFATVAAVIVAALGVEVGHLGAHKSTQVTNLSALAFRAADADPHARHLILASADGTHTVRAVIIADGTTYLGPGNLPTLPADETYQMWGVVAGTRISLGPIGDTATYAAFPTPAVATVIAMTVEPRGGVVTSSKTPVVAATVPDA